MYKYILFDLDGTITDSSKGITNCVKYALEAAKWEIPETDRLLEFIGPPLTEGFMTISKMSEKEAEGHRCAVMANEPYDGIEKMLKTLKENGYILAVATSKPEETAKRIIEHFGLKKYFKEITGSTFDAVRNTKQSVIEETLKRLGITDAEKESVLMVGDRKHDVVGAHNCGIDVLGVYYGFAKSGELEDILFQKLRK